MSLSFYRLEFPKILIFCFKNLSQIIFEIDLKLYFSISRENFFDIFRKNNKRLFNSHGTRRRYPSRYEEAVYSQEIYNSVIDAFAVNFRFISGEISAEKNSWKIFIAPKDSSLNFSGSLLGYFWAIMLISAVISNLEDFGSLLPPRPIAVKRVYTK